MQRKTHKKSSAGSSRLYTWLPVSFLIGSFLLMLLPLEGFVSSVKVVLAYIFIPQVRASHETVKYMENVHQTVQELLKTHRENRELKQQIEMANLLNTQARQIMLENERLNTLLGMAAQKRWNGVWTHVAYREPTQWNVVIVDKGSLDGIRPRSAVLSLEQDQVGLVGIVLETTEKTSKVLLLRDKDFAAAVQVGHTQETGLLQGNGSAALQIKYLSLQADVHEGDEVYTASSSSIFPAGIRVGKVSNVRQGKGFQTALTVEVDPWIRPAAVKELFVITNGGEK